MWASVVGAAPADYPAAADVSALSGGSCCCSCCAACVGLSPAAGLSLKSPTASLAVQPSTAERLFPLSSPCFAGFPLAPASVLSYLCSSPSSDLPLSASSTMSFPVGDPAAASLARDAACSSLSFCRRWYSPQTRLFRCVKAS